MKKSIEFEIIFANPEKDDWCFIISPAIIITREYAGIQFSFVWGFWMFSVKFNKK
jgi:hypothetical protein